MLGSKVPNADRKSVSIKETAFGHLLQKGAGRSAARPFLESLLEAGFRPEFGVFMPSTWSYVILDAFVQGTSARILNFHVT